MEDSSSLYHYGVKGMNRGDSMGDELYHYGVKGMKWGVRRAEKRSAKENLDRRNKRYNDKARRQDNNEYGSSGVKRINRRMNKGQSLQKARDREDIRRGVKSTVAKSLASLAVADIMTDGAIHQLAGVGARYAGSFISRNAKRAVSDFVSSQAAKNAARAAREAIPRLGEEIIELKPWQYRVY